MPSEFSGLEETNSMKTISFLYFHRLQVSRLKKKLMNYGSMCLRQLLLKCNKDFILLKFTGEKCGCGLSSHFSFLLFSKTNLRIL